MGMFESFNDMKEEKKALEYRQNLEGNIDDGGGVGQRSEANGRLDDEDGISNGSSGKSLRERIDYALEDVHEVCIVEISCCRPNCLLMQNNVFHFLKTHVSH